MSHLWPRAVGARKWERRNFTPNCDGEADCVSQCRVSGRLLRDLRTFAAVRNWSWLNQRMFGESLCQRARRARFFAQNVQESAVSLRSSFEWRIVDSERPQLLAMASTSSGYANPAVVSLTGSTL